MSAVVSQAACANCDGSRWVCENHPDRPWEGMSAPGEGCGCGAGAPCPCCDLERAAARYIAPLRELVERSIALLESAERETNWGDPLFGPSPSEEIQAALDALAEQGK